MGKREQPLRAAGTLTDLAEALGVSKRRVSQLLEAGMPEDPVEALEWRAQKEGGDGSNEQLRKERILLVRAQREKIELEMKVKRGELLPRAAQGEAFEMIGVLTKTMLQRMEAELPPILEGMSPAKMTTLIREKGREILEETSNAEQRAKEH